MTGQVRPREARRGIALCCGIALFQATGAFLGSAAAEPGRATVPRRDAARADPALAAFHARLLKLAAGEGRAIEIVQLGDSHTAGDQLTGRLRQLLQARFGDAGRGLMPAGAPYPGYKPRQVAVTQSARWQVLASNLRAGDGVRFGISGFVTRTSAAGESIVYRLAAPARASVLEIGYEAGPGRGRLDVAVDERLVATIGTADTQVQVRRERVEVGSGTRIDLVTRDAADVVLGDVRFIGGSRGVTLSNLGVSGAEIGVMGRWDATRMARELALLDPALVLVAFGTNEGFASVARIEASYRAEAGRRLDAIRAALPGAAIVVIGPPDANRFPRACLPPELRRPPAKIAAKSDGPGSGHGDPVSKTPSATLPPVLPPAAVVPDAAAKVPPRLPVIDPRDTARCEPLTAAERRDYDRLLSADSAQLCRWHTPPALPLVRELLREVSAQRGILFWDWSALTGADCGADRWFRRGLMSKDRVHQTPAGYARAAERLYEVLLAGFPARH